MTEAYKILTSEYITDFQF